MTCDAWSDSVKSTNLARNRGSLRVNETSSSHASSAPATGHFSIHLLHDRRRDKVWGAHYWLIDAPARRKIAESPRTQKSPRDARAFGTKKDCRPSSLKGPPAKSGRPQYDMEVRTDYPVIGPQDKHKMRIHRRPRLGLENLRNLCRRRGISRDCGTTPPDL